MVLDPAPELPVGKLARERFRSARLYGAVEVQGVGAVRYGVHDRYWAKVFLGPRRLSLS